VTVDLIVIIEEFSMSNEEFNTGKSMPWHDALYFTIVTLSTVGYGDILPTTTASRIFISMVICVALVAVSKLVSNVLNAAAKISKWKNRYMIQRNQPHVVLCGSPAGTYLHFFAELFSDTQRLENEQLPTVAILNSGDPSEEIKMLVSQFHPMIQYIDGSPLDEGGWDLVRLDKARAIVVLPIAKDGVDQTENHSLLVAMSVYKYCSQLIDKASSYQDGSHSRKDPDKEMEDRRELLLDRMPAMSFMVMHRRSKDRLLDLRLPAQVVAKQEMRDTLTALGSLLPGFLTFFGNAIKSDPGVVVQEKWQEEYVNGANHEVYLVDPPEPAVIEELRESLQLPGPVCYCHLARLLFKVNETLLLGLVVDEAFRLDTRRVTSATGARHHHTPLSPRILLNPWNLEMVPDELGEVICRFIFLGRSKHAVDSAMREFREPETIARAFTRVQKHQKDESMDDVEEGVRLSEMKHMTPLTSKRSVHLPPAGLGLSNASQWFEAQALTASNDVAPGHGGAHSSMPTTEDHGLAASHSRELVRHIKQAEDLVKDLAGALRVEGGNSSASDGEESGDEADDEQGRKTATHLRSIQSMLRMARRGVRGLRLDPIGRGSTGGASGSAPLRNHIVIEAFAADEKAIISILVCLRRITGTPVVVLMSSKNKETISQVQRQLRNLNNSRYFVGGHYALPTRGETKEEEKATGTRPPELPEGKRCVGDRVIFMADHQDFEKDVLTQANVTAAIAVIHCANSTVVASSLQERRDADHQLTVKSAVSWQLFLAHRTRHPHQRTPVEVTHVVHQLFVDESLSFISHSVKDSPLESILAPSCVDNSSPAALHFIPAFSRKSTSNHSFFGKLPPSPAGRGMDPQRTSLDDEEQEDRREDELEAKLRIRNLTSMRMQALSDDSLFAWPSYAAGRVFSETMIELLMAQGYFSPLEIRFWETLIGVQASSAADVVQPPLFARSQFSDPPNAGHMDNFSLSEAINNNTGGIQLRSIPIPRELLRLNRPLKYYHILDACHEDGCVPLGLYRATTTIDLDSSEVNSSGMGSTRPGAGNRMDGGRPGFNGPRTQASSRMKTTQATMPYMVTNPPPSTVVQPQDKLLLLLPSSTQRISDLHHSRSASSYSETQSPLLPQDQGQEKH